MSEVSQLIAADHDAMLCGFPDTQNGIARVTEPHGLGDEDLRQAPAHVDVGERSDVSCP
jgi:hypothetical protein